jgi:Na+/melibiose symporter-like transporter
LIHGWGWQAVFVVPLPLSMLCSFIVLALLPQGVGLQAQPAWRARLWAVLLLLAATALLQLGLADARVPQHFASLQLAGQIALALLALAGWWWHQRGHQAPLLHWQGLRHPGYLAGLGLYGLYYLIANANGVVLPVFAERVLGLPTWQVGLLGSGGALVSWLAARAYLRWGARSDRKPALMAGAAALMALACFGLALWPSGWPALPVLAASVAAKGAFGALFVLPLAGLTFRELADEHFGPGYQLKNLLRHLMISAGMTLAALGLSPGPAGVSTLARAGAHLFDGLGLASLLLMGWVALQRRLR